MQEVQKLFYRAKGARYPDQLIKANDFKIDRLPRDTVLHVYGSEAENPDIDVKMPFFHGYNKKTLVKFVTDYIKPQGSFKTPSFNIQTLTSAWRKKNLKLWGMDPMPWKTAGSPDQLVVINYGYLDHVHRYLPMKIAELDRWKNRFRTLFSTMNTIANESGRNQYVVLKITAQIQGKTLLDRFVNKADNVAAINIFGSYDMDGFLQLELWRWLSTEHRSLSLLNEIEPKNYGKINLIFEGHTGNQELVNLAYLNSWIKGQPNTTEIASIIQLPELAIQKLFLKLCMAINGNGFDENTTEPELQQPVTVKAPLPFEKNSDGDVIETDGETILMDDTDDTETNAMGGEGAMMSDLHKVSAKGKPGSVQHAALDDKAFEQKLVDLEKKGRTGDYTNELMKTVEADIEALDRISLVQLKNKGITDPDEDGALEKPETPIDVDALKAAIYTSRTGSEVVSAMLVDNAESNMVTAADFRKMNVILGEHLNSDDPYGSGLKRKEASLIKKEELVITPENKQIVTSGTVPDKTMASSSLTAFNKSYVRHVMRKDILNVVDGIQQAGVLIKKHEITEMTSALGTYEQHRLELKPIDGQPSAISFTLPKVNEDGTFIAGSNKYLQRKARADVPIRKIAPAIVALSTYYGKTFVQVNPKAVNNSIGWIYRQINLSIVTEGSAIHSVSPGNVFNNELAVPYIYGAIGAEFEKFSVGKDLTLDFNYAQREKNANGNDLSAIEKNGRVFCGFFKKMPVVVDKANHFFAIGQTETLLGDVYDVLQLPREKSPVDFSEIRIFSKYIPTGIVLGYYLGFKALVALTGIKYRIVQARKQKNLEADEFAVVFKDLSYVFKRDNAEATLLIAGFLDYEKSTKFYDSDLFNHKDVYLNLLLTKSMRSIYVRELDMMEHAFVDPISKEILEGMNEPVTFKGLIIRANQLLMTYHHPVSQDRTAMRDRGYERFAGAVYKELMTATRQFKNKNLAGRSKIDMSPYEVWNSIMKDNSIKVVEDINPIQNLKEDEVITFAGAGGRNKDTMTKPTRAYHINDVGVLSESTVDSSSVGTIAYLSADPNLSDVRGMMSKEKTLNPTSMLSTSALISPASFTDN